ncbi:uncharacterized protein LOC126657090 [Mercurialis annua]|uniref:uncharacterized protein LOC126657090 n=1 Tax=Mercurialis annua TaxID=3986 RepID=UPI00215E8BE1|nr:uncharacterized protein LOC126657090 [Mercurialis annua]
MEDDYGLITSTLSEEIRVEKVKSLMVADNGIFRWDEDILTDLFNETDQRRIRTIPLNNAHYEDRTIWLPDLRGIFSVRSAYRIQQLNISRTSHINSKFLQQLWTRRIPSKYKVFMLRATRNWLPTRDNLISRRVEMQDNVIQGLNSVDQLWDKLYQHGHTNLSEPAVMTANGSHIQFKMDSMLSGGDVSWSKPQSGELKMNAAFNNTHRCMAAVIRDDRGQWVGSLLFPNCYAPNTAVAEAWGLKEALS